MDLDFLTNVYVFSSTPSFFELQATDQILDGFLQSLGRITQVFSDKLRQHQLRHRHQQSVTTSFLLQTLCRALLTSEATVLAVALLEYAFLHVKGCTWSQNFFNLHCVPARAVETPPASEQQEQPSLLEQLEERRRIEKYQLPLWKKLFLSLSSSFVPYVFRTHLTVENLTLWEVKLESWKSEWQEPERNDREWNAEEVWQDCAPSKEAPPKEAEAEVGNLQEEDSFHEQTWEEYEEKFAAGTLVAVRDDLLERWKRMVRRICVRIRALFWVFCRFLLYAGRVAISLRKALKCVDFGYRVFYLLDLTKHWSWQYHLLRLCIDRQPPPAEPATEKEEKEGAADAETQTPPDTDVITKYVFPMLGDSFGFFFWASMYAAQFGNWYYNNRESLVQDGDGGGGSSNNRSIPPEPPLKRDKTPVLQDPRLCFLCKRSWRHRNPAQSIGGYIFCYSCLSQHLSEHETCPISNQKMLPKQIRTILLPDSFV